MQEKQVVILGISLLIASSTIFLISWFVLGRAKQRSSLGAERIWLRCLATCFYVGLAILLASALGSVVQHAVKGSR